MGRQFYSGFLAIYMYGTLWAYSTVFAKSFASHLPMTFLFAANTAQDQSYYLYLVIFGLLVVPMSLMEFTEQIAVQVALTVFRIVMLVVMVTSIAVAYYSGGSQFSDIPVSSAGSTSDVVAFFVVLFPALDVASAYPLNAYTLGNNMMSLSGFAVMFIFPSLLARASRFKLLAVGADPKT
eukprot:gene30878-38162_t